MDMIHMGVDSKIVTFLPWTALDSILTGYDYGLNYIISHGLVDQVAMSHVQY